MLDDPARRLDDLPVCLIVAHRPDEPGAPLDLPDGLQRAPSLTRLAIAPPGPTRLQAGEPRPQELLHTADYPAMTGTVTGWRARVRPFVIYGVIGLVPVLVLGFVLATSFRDQARNRGLAQGRAEGVLVGRTAVAPLLGDRPVHGRLTPEEMAGLRRLTARTVTSGEVLRLRIRDLGAHVVFSDDNSGFAGPADDEALDAAHGRVVALLTRVNADSNDSGAVGTSSVEVYVPLTDQATRRPIAVLELYLPYGPIAHDVTAGLRRMYVALVVGLGVLYLTLFAISISVSRGLRRESVRNAFLAEHDALTELPNRTLFRRQATTAIRLSRRRGRSVAVAIVDLDRFKEVNDTLGHDSGDQLLIELARRLAGADATRRHRRPARWRRVRPHPPRRRRCRAPPARSCGA